MCARGAGRCRRRFEKAAPPSPPLDPVVLSHFHPLQLQVNFERSHGRASTEVILGKTRVFTVVTASVEEPFPDRPTEGFIGFNVDLSPMASPAYEVSKTARWRQERFVCEEMRLTACPFFRSRLSPSLSPLPLSLFSPAADGRPPHFLQRRDSSHAGASDP